jgi:arylsulfatase
MLPTTLDIVGVKAPEYIKGIKQDTLQGTSLAYSINNKTAPSKHTIQYYYIFGSRSIYKDGWKAAFAFEPSASNGLVNKFSVEDTLHNYWHLYNLNDDFNERIDLAKKYPEKLNQLKALFDEEATKYRLYPLVTWDDIIDRVRKMMSTPTQTQIPKSK